MSYATLTSKGQMTIPSDVRSKLKLHAGDTLEVLVKGDVITLIPINKSVKRLEGYLPKPSKALTIEEMDEEIGRAVLENDRY